MSHYTWHNVTENSRITIRLAFATFSLISEIFIFLYVTVWMPWILRSGDLLATDESVGELVGHFFLASHPDQVELLLGGGEESTVCRCNIQEHHENPSHMHQLMAHD